RGQGRDRAICEWDFPAPQRRVNAIRTERYRLVYYSHKLGGELYDHASDPYEMHNRWDDATYRDARLELLERLFDEINQYTLKSDMDTDVANRDRNRFTPTHRIHKGCEKWSRIQPPA
ncbi:MAG: DUF4976 domain-containing protein, partial [Planctomycetes bacterium]|nr:DUF4976 domain-containing protein [Planctomycetota bacterium]